MTTTGMTTTTAMATARGRRRATPTATTEPRFPPGRPPVATGRAVVTRMRGVAHAGVEGAPAGLGAHPVPVADPRDDAEEPGNGQVHRVGREAQHAGHPLHVGTE